VGAVWARFRIEARARRWGWAGLALLVGLSAGSVLAIVAGGRRTDSAYERFVAASRPSDFLIGDSILGLPHRISLDAVERLPGVESTSLMSFVPAVGRTSSGRRVMPAEAAPLAPSDSRLGVSIDRWKLLSGRRANQQRVDEAVASFEFARKFHVQVGSTIRLRFQREATVLKLTQQFIAGVRDRVAGRADPVDLAEILDGPEVTFRVVGIEAAPFEFPPRGSLLPPLELTRAFSDKYRADLARQDILRVRLRASTDRVAFRAAVERLAGGQAPPFFEERTVSTQNVRRSIHLAAFALWALAGLVAVSVAFTLAQAFARQAYAEVDNVPTLVALGMTRHQLVAGAALRAGATGLIGAAFAVAVAVLLSPIWPTGLARDAEPHPGLAADWTVLGLGAAAIFFFAIVAGATSAELAVRGRDNNPPTGAPVLVSHLLSESGLPVPAVIGVGHALGPGRGRTAVPVRSAMVATGLAVATIVVAATFAASTDHLLGTPRLYGWTSDAQIRTMGFPGYGEPVVAGLQENPSVVGVAAGTMTELRVAGKRVRAIALDDVRGSLRPDLVEGRPPRRADEIVLGTQTLDDAGVAVGDQVEVRIRGNPARMLVVGRALFPEIGDVQGELGRGAQITFTALRNVASDTSLSDVRLEIAPHTNKASVIARLRRAVVPLPVNAPEPPTTITSFGRANNLPAVVVAIMVAVAAATLTSAMVISVRRRRRDFAVLETLGYVGRQLSITVAAQATTFACVACLVGIPLGVVMGQWTWTGVAHALGIPAEPTVSLLALILIAPVLIVLTNAVALLPASIARRTRPAVALRAE
jgi:hypothetical protein